MIINKTAIEALNALLNEEDLSSSIKDILIHILCSVDDTDDIGILIITLLGLLDIGALRQIREIINQDNLIKIALINTFI